MTNRAEGKILIIDGQFKNFGKTKSARTNFYLVVDLFSTVTADWSICEKLPRHVSCEGCSPIRRRISSVTFLLYQQLRRGTIINGNWERGVVCTRVVCYLVFSASIFSSRCLRTSFSARLFIVITKWTGVMRRDVARRGVFVFTATTAATFPD